MNKYFVYTTAKQEPETIIANDVVWGNGVVQFLIEDDQTNSIIKIETAPKPSVCYSFHHLVKVEYGGKVDG